MHLLSIATGVSQNKLAIHYILVKILHSVSFHSNPPQGIYEQESQLPCHQEQSTVLSIPSWKRDKIFLSVFAQVANALLLPLGCRGCSSLKVTTFDTRFCRGMI